MTSWAGKCVSGGAAWRAIRALQSTEDEVKATTVAGGPMLTIKRETDGVDARVYAWADGGPERACCISLDDVPPNRVRAILIAAGLV